MESFNLFVGFGCLLIVILALNISRLRYKERIAHGYGDSKILRNAIVAHSNALEHLIPFAFILFVLIEQNTSSALVQGLAIGFLILRVIHALGVTQFVFRAWQISSALSYALTLFSSCLILYNWFIL